MSACKHPTTEQIKWEAWQRWRALAERHRATERMLWAGTVASQFSDFELSLIGDLISVSDRQWIASVRGVGK